MTAFPRIALAALSLAAAAAALGAPAATQEVLLLSPGASVPRSERVSAEVQAFHPGPSTGGFGWVRVRLHNRHSEPHVVGVRLSAEGGEAFQVVRAVELDLREKAELVLPFPASGRPAELRLTLDGTERGRVPGLGRGRADGLSVLLIGPTPQFGRAWRTMLEDVYRAYLASRSASRRPTALVGEVAVCQPQELPADWTRMTAFDLVIADGAHRDWDVDSARVVERLLAGGGRVLLRRPEELPPSGLRELAGGAEADGGEPGEIRGGGGGGDGGGDGGDRGGRAARAAHLVQHRLGTLCAVPEGAAYVTPEVAHWLFGTPFGLGAPLAGDVSGPAPAAFYLDLRLPGVAGLPIHWFFTIILVFVLFVGPINHVFFRRRGRPWMVLLTVPVLGIAVTALILGFSILHEGLDLRGAMHSVSLLDQREHRLVTCASRTLFAGLSPPRIAPPPESYLFAGDQLRPGSGPLAPRYLRDLDRGVIDGAILPSRRPTAFVTVAQETCRERIRFRRAAGDRLDVLHSDGIAVAAGTDALVLRDFEGRYYAMRSDGTMRSVKRSEADRAVFEMCLPFRVFDTRWRKDRGKAPPARVMDWVRHRIGGELEPGCYIARTSAPPADADLGLDPVYGTSVHLVRGFLDAKDIIDG